LLGFGRSVQRWLVTWRIDEGIVLGKRYAHVESRL
jgi:hypothetical protein